MGERKERNLLVLAYCQTSVVTTSSAFLELFLLIGTQRNIYPRSMSTLPYKLWSQHLREEKHGEAQVKDRSASAPAPPAVGK